MFADAENQRSNEQPSSMSKYSTRDADDQTTPTETTKQMNYLWVPMAISIGILYSIADVILSNSMSSKGIWAVGFLGPSTVFSIGVYRMIQACKLRYHDGIWIDKTNSNYWVAEYTSLNDASALSS